MQGKITIVLTVALALSLPFVMAGSEGAEWSSVPSPKTTEQLSSVFMLSSDDGWAVGWGGLGGTILRWDGSQWSVVPSPANYGLRSIYMLSPSEGWAVGFNGTILRYYEVAEAGGADEALNWPLIALGIAAACIAVGAVLLLRRRRAPGEAESWGLE